MINLKLALEVQPLPFLSRYVAIRLQSPRMELFVFTPKELVDRAHGASVTHALSHMVRGGQCLEWNSIFIYVEPYK